MISNNLHNEQTKGVKNVQWQQLQAEYKSAKKQLEQYDKNIRHEQVLQRQIEETKHKIASHEETLERLRKRLEKEESFSFLSFVRNLTGKKQQILEERLTEAMTEELKLIESQLMLEDLQDDLVSTVQFLNATTKVELEAKLSIIETKKRTWLEEYAPTYADRLIAIDEEQEVLEELKRELQEAIDAANMAILKLQDVLTHLQKAKDYSVWDTFLGGGLIATHMKHEKLKSSELLLHQAQRALQSFQNELADIENMRQETFRIDVDRFVKMADYFLDDIFSEWSIHSKIKTKIAEIHRLLDDLYNTEMYLKQKLDNTLQRLEQLQQKEEEIYMLDPQILSY